MNIKNYKLFLEKDRDDEYSYMNDDLDKRWDDSTYDPYEDDYKDNYEYDDEYDYGSDDYSDDIDDDDMEHLLYLLRTMFKNSGIEPKITNKRMDIKILIHLTPKERLKYIISIFEIINKLKKDILIQYTCEFEMWETRMGKPYFDFTFVYDNDDSAF